MDKTFDVLHPLPPEVIACMTWNGIINVLARTAFLYVPRALDFCCSCKFDWEPTEGLKRVPYTWPDGTIDLIERYEGPPGVGGRETVDAIPGIDVPEDSPCNSVAKVEAEYSRFLSILELTIEIVRLYGAS